MQENRKESCSVKSLLALVAVVGFAGAALAQSGTTSPAKPAAKAPAKAAAAPVCPITGEKVSDIKMAEKSTYKGKTYYFCCGGCKPMFDKNPAKYVKAEPAKPAAKPADSKKKV
jgi:YHS domain-containing protein